MEMQVFAGVLLAALLHAGWNSTIKVGLDMLSSVLLLTLVPALIALPILPFVPRPAPAAWPWILTAALLHAGYKCFLVHAYTLADLSQVHPIARGTAPLLVTLASALALGVAFRPAEILATGSISGGILLVAAKGGSRGWMRGKALFYALGTAWFTASYTLVDGIGARIAETASGFILWMVIGEAIEMAGYRRRSHVAGLILDRRPGLHAGPDRAGRRAAGIKHSLRHLDRCIRAARAGEHMALDLAAAILLGVVPLKG